MFTVCYHSVRSSSSCLQKQPSGSENPEKDDSLNKNFKNITINSKTLLRSEQLIWKKHFQTSSSSADSSLSVPPVKKIAMTKVTGTKSNHIFNNILKQSSAIVSVQNVLNNSTQNLRVNKKRTKSKLSPYTFKRKNKNGPNQKVQPVLITVKCFCATSVSGKFKTPEYNL